MLLSPPVDIELWIILLYVAVVLAGARIVEALARVHFARAQSYGEKGFEYLEAHDAYRCPQGEYLVLHNVHQDSRLAVYRAPLSSCKQCRFKAQCAPFSDRRLVFRSLATWAETNVGVFHGRVSAIMFAAAVVLCVAGLRRWAGHAGSGWLAGALLAGVVLLLQEVRTILPKVPRLEHPKKEGFEADVPQETDSRSPQTVDSIGNAAVRNRVKH